MAINILANVVHQELADDGIRTVALAPGLTDTPGMAVGLMGSRPTPGPATLRHHDIGHRLPA